MKKFESISEKEILDAAYITILDRWLRRIDKNREYREKHGKESKIGTYWIEKYRAQLDELHDAICEIEQQQDAE